MYPLNKILVALDGSELDATIIKFAAFISRVSDTDTIYFVNVIRHMNIPAAVQKEFPGIIENALEERKAQLEASIAKEMEGANGVKTACIVENGQPARKILEMTEKYKIDLAIVGRKNQLKGSGVLSHRLARRAVCSLLIVPEGAMPESRKILVPIDFSQYAQNALEQAINIGTRVKNEVEIICQNVYNVPVGYHYTGKSYEEFRQIMQKNAEADFKKFIKSIDLKGLKVRECYSLDEDEDPVADIYEKAVKVQASLMVIGAKGRTASTALFIGSMAERLIQINDTIPMVVVRPKGKAAGWLDIIKDI